MFIMTENNRIINLNCYPSIIVETDRAEPNMYRLRAISGTDSEGILVGYPIATFNEKADADYAYHNLFKAMTAEKPTWNARTAEPLSSLWSKVKQEFSEDVISPESLAQLELNVSDLHEITITYPRRGKSGAPIGSSNEEPDIEKKLIEVLNTQPSTEVEWKVKWESAD